MADKNSFVLYVDSKDVVDRLTDEQAGQLFKAIFDYEANGALPELDAMTDIVFMTMRQHLDRNRVKYAETCRKRSEAGKKGMASRWHGKKDITNVNGVITNITNDNKAYQSITNITDSDNDSDNDSDIVIDNESDIDNDKGVLSVTERINMTMKKLGYA